MNPIAIVVLFCCFAVSIFAFTAAMRTLDVRVRWWRVIAGLMLLRLSNAVLTPVWPWVEHAWHLMWSSGG